MKVLQHVPGITVLMSGVLLGIFSASHWNAASLSKNVQAADAAKPDPASPATLRAELDEAKGKLPGQAHVMMDVAYHYNNLWFAGTRGNWPLAEFYFGETRSHLRWAVRVIPVRKDNQGREVKLADILQAVENSPLKDLESAIKAKDREKFIAAYQFTLTSCYSCHKAVDKPYLVLRIPDHPAEEMIDFNPPAAPISTSTTPAQKK